MAEAKTRLGKLPCSKCGEPTMVLRNAQGTLSQACQECGWSAFSKKGEPSHGATLRELTAAGHAPPPDQPPGTPAPAPAARPSGAFVFPGA